MKNFLKIILVILLLALSSCRKENIPSNEQQRFCEHWQRYDSLTTATKLIGKWKWVSEYNIWTNTTTPANKNVQVIFKNDGTYIETENSAVISQGSWYCEIFDANIWRLHITQPNMYLYGGVFFCNNNSLGFLMDYVDGPDYHFTRIN